MNICILTQPLESNYGGILQNYALQQVLKGLGHCVWTEDRKRNKIYPIDYIKKNSYIRKLFRKSKIKPSPSDLEFEIINRNINLFVERYINCTKPVNSSDKSIFKEYDFNAYIVGSDQVWRPIYSYGLYNYFLDFVKEKQILKIAYAASFGVDVWEYNLFQTYKCKHLLKKFNALSVREDSAVRLCQDKLGCLAEQLIDPTLLLTKNDYKQLISQSTLELINYKGIAIYILDYSKEKQEIVEYASTCLGKTVYSLMPESKYSIEKNSSLLNCIYPPVEQWLKGLMDADFIITDSFHGTIFSILFGKKFISIVNEDRGKTRFTSLLNMFNLDERLISFNQKPDNSLLYSDIDYSFITRVIDEQKSKSLSFLMNNLKN